MGAKESRDDELSRAVSELVREWQFDWGTPSHRNDPKSGTSLSIGRDWNPQGELYMLFTVFRGFPPPPEVESLRYQFRGDDNRTIDRVTNRRGQVALLTRDGFHAGRWHVGYLGLASSQRPAWLLEIDYTTLRRIARQLLLSSQQYRDQDGTTTMVKRVIQAVQQVTTLSRLALQERDPLPLLLSIMIAKFIERTSAAGNPRPSDDDQTVSEFLTALSDPEEESAFQRDCREFQEICAKAVSSWEHWDGITQDIIRLRINEVCDVSMIARHVNRRPDDVAATLDAFTAQIAAAA